MNFPCFTTHPRSTFNFRDMTPEQRTEYEKVFYSQIKKAMQEFRPDIVHAQHVWTLAGISAKCCEEKDIYNIADVSCVPSRREPFGLVAAEAMACGTPVIATNEGGLPDFINEKVGILVPVDDSEKLALAVKQVISGEKVFDREEIAKEAKDKHSVDKKVDEFKERYKIAIKNIEKDFER